jgi:aminopeptidase
MKDPRNRELAKVFVEHSLSVKKGDNVVISTSDLDCIDLINECMALSLDKGAQVYLDILGWNWLLDRSSAGDLVRTYYDHADEKMLAKPPKIYEDIINWGDKFIRITTFDNYAHMSGVNGEKKQIRERARRKWFNRLIDEKMWVLTYYPTPGLAQQSGMSYNQLVDFYFSATLVDYKKMQKQAKKVSDVMDKGKEVRIVGEKTDITLDITGRLAEAASGDRNVPDGEVFLAPVHKKTEGVVFFDLPNYRDGVDVVGARLVFKKGKVVEATAEQGEDVLLNALDTDRGSRYLGELGLGVNYGITKPMRNTLFDEKIGGTVHMAVGKSYTEKRGGAPKDPNKSAVHWDLVKDMRKKGSEIYVDGKLVFKNGKWLV